MTCSANRKRFETTDVAYNKEGRADSLLKVCLLTFDERKVIIITLAG
jgi:hypothetical protein